MTRKEEIEQVFKKIDEKYHYDALYGACVDIAEWADETIIEKACKWLYDNINKYYQPFDYFSYTRERFLNDFKEAMKK